LHIRDCANNQNFMRFTVDLATGKRGVGLASIAQNHAVDIARPIGCFQSFGVNGMVAR
jgi:hypothetical protein